jgi:hypothetical protein
MLAGEAVVMMATESRGATNEKAKRELGWTLRYPSWRQGFADTYGSASNDSGAQATKSSGAAALRGVERRAA